MLPKDPIHFYLSLASSNKTTASQAYATETQGVANLLPIVSIRCSKFILVLPCMFDAPVGDFGKADCL